MASKPIPLYDAHVWAWAEHRILGIYARATVAGINRVFGK